jgi:2'-5' RNA ligase
MMEKIRTFISIDMSENIQKEIEKIQNILPGFEGKKTEPENLHLTLKFLGEIDSEKLEKVKEKLKEINFKKFETRVSEIGVFSPEYIRIVWLKLENCSRLQNIIDKKLSELFEPERRFMSHLTIARVKFLKNKNYFLGELKKVKLPKMKFKVDKFRLKKSTLTEEGPIHETLEEYALN